MKRNGFLDRVNREKEAAEEQEDDDGEDDPS